MAIDRIYSIYVGWFYHFGIILWPMSLLHGVVDSHVLGEEGLVGLIGAEDRCRRREWSVWDPVRVLLRDVLLVALWTGVLLGVFNYLHNLQRLCDALWITGCNCLCTDVRI